MLPAYAQQPVRHDHHVMYKVDAAYEEGRISLDQKVLYKFYAGLKPEKLPSEFKTGSKTFIKCGTPAQIDFKKHRNQLSASIISEIELLTDRSAVQAQESYLSPSGKFILRYETSGNNAVPADDGDNNGIPDYVEQTAAAADSSFRHEVERLGYADPIAPDNTYEIFFKNFGFYGQTVSSGNTTFIEIHSNFQNFPPNTDPEGDVPGAIKVTMAHELKHAIQFVTNNWSGETDRWAEMDATLMEEVVYDNVNDYYNYLTNSSSIFQNPQNSFYPGSYFHVTWALFFEQKYGPDFWPNVWSRIEENPAGLRYTDAMTEELGGNDQFQQDYIESHLWHFASGLSNSLEGYGFEEALKYPTASSSSGTEFLTNDFSIPRATSQKSLNSFSASYIRITPNNSLTGQLIYELIPSENSGVGLIFIFEDGSFQTQIFSDANLKKASIVKSNRRWEEIQSIKIVFANPNTGNSSQSPLVFLGANEPEEFSISQNYPNPFNPTTEIRFSLPAEMQVQLQVYDITGRLVGNLIDETLPAGNYQETFNGSNLASGVYFYRLRANDQVMVRKMMLIK